MHGLPVEAYVPVLELRAELSSPLLQPAHWMCLEASASVKDYALGRIVFLLSALSCTAFGRDCVAAGTIFLSGHVCRASLRA